MDGHELLLLLNRGIIHLQIIILSLFTLLMMLFLQATTQKGEFLKCKSSENNIINNGRMIHVNVFQKWTDRTLDFHTTALNEEALYDDIYMLLVLEWRCWGIFPQALVLWYLTLFSLTHCLILNYDNVVCFVRLFILAINAFDSKPRFVELFIYSRVSQSGVREPLVVREGIAGGSLVGTSLVN